MPLSEMNTKLVVGLIREARRKTDGSIPGMTAYLERRKTFMVDQDLARHEAAIEIITLDEELALVVPQVVTGPKLKKDMVVEVSPHFNVRLTRDSYIDPADKKLTIDAVRLDNNQEYRAVVEANYSYFVIPPTRACVNDMDFGLAT